MMKKRILLIDDSPFMLKVVSDLLTDLDYDVEASDNSRDALAKASECRFDLIMTDMNMPEMDGIAFAQEVRHYPNCRFVPIVMISGEKNDEKIARAKKMGVSTFLSKPLKEAQIKTMLHIMLNKRSAPRIPVKLEVFYDFNKLFTNVKAAYTFNVSMGGMFVETDTPLEPGLDLELKLSLPEEASPLMGQGRVAWINEVPSPDHADHPQGMGVEFLSLENEKVLQSFLHSGLWKR
ncbi:MAG: hypothetical protein C0621_08530 [Desulfuromonas sp.]|nr:MAG: hypothetical protein C0621_08530 [Desulfuromonas sp.]